MKLDSEEYMARLKDTLMKTGFPLELEVDDTLRKLNWFTFPSHHYLDEEGGTQREIDNYALFPDQQLAQNRFSPIGLSPHLLVECKKLDEISAVILCRDQKAVTHYDFSGQMYDFPWLIEHRAPTPRYGRSFISDGFSERRNFTILPLPTESVLELG